MNEEQKQLLKNIIKHNKSHDAIIELYKNNFEEDLILELICLGQLGEDKNKKSIPKKWANTMYDKTISEYLINKIKEFDNISSIELFNIDKYDNEFLIILLPSNFSLEFVEKSPSFFEFDYVGFDNKLGKSKPSCAGAFYSVQLGILEYLLDIKKQARILIIRNMKYDIGIGSKKLREVLRLGIKNKLNKFENLKELDKSIFENFNLFYNLYKDSNILKKLKQKSLINFY